MVKDMFMWFNGYFAIMPLWLSVGQALLLARVQYMETTWKETGCYTLTLILVVSMTECGKMNANMPNLSQCHITWPYVNLIMWVIKATTKCWEVHKWFSYVICMQWTDLLVIYWNVKCYFIAIAKVLVNFALLELNITLVMANHNCNFTRHCFDTRIDYL